MNELFISKAYHSVIGDIAVLSSVSGIRRIIIAEKSLPIFKTGDPFNAINQIASYFESHLKTFNLPIDIEVTDFTRKVLQETSKIPYGFTSSYGEIAHSINNPRAFRAVGGALNRNPVPIIIPCHRVLAKNSLGGFALGFDIKINLLELEGADLNSI